MARKNFAFIRFLKVKDNNLLAENLNSMKIDGVKTAVNVEKYDKNKNQIWSSSERNKVTFVRLTKNRNNDQVRNPPPNLNSNRDCSRSYKDALNGYKTNPQQSTNGQRAVKSVSIPPEFGAQYGLWKDSSLIGEVCNMSKINNVLVGLKAEGITDINIKYLGGLLVMIIFKNESDANNFLVNGKSTWSS